MFSVMFSRDEYLVSIVLSIQILLDGDKVQFAVVVETRPFSVTDTSPPTNVGMRYGLE